jgi:PilZ domain-containing protein
MEEKRKHQRSEVNEPAYVSADGSVMSCMVRNISPEGAAIDIDDPAFVPARFRLVMSGGAVVRECQVAWLRDKRIGLTFVATPQKAASLNAVDQVLG